MESKKRRNAMNSERKTAIIVGILFISATAAALLSGVFLGSIVESADGLAALSANRTPVILAVIFELIIACSVIGTGFMLFPVLRKYVESLALAYAGFRICEALMLVVGSISLLSLLTLSQEIASGSMDTAVQQSAGAVLLAIRDWVWIVGPMIFLGLGGLSLYSVLFRSKLIPHWLSVWGLFGATLILLTGMLGLIGLSGDTLSVSTALALPIGLQEMVFAVWLIVKGFNRKAIAPESAERE